MTLRAANESDRDLVLGWRNHPVVRAASLQQQVISAQQHRRWWNSLADDPTRQLLIYRQAGHDCGVVTFQHIDRHQRSAHWGFYLDNDGLDAREGTLRAWMQIQREAVEYADTVLDLDTLDSEVLDGNVGVLKFNQRNGCAVVGQRSIEIDGRLVQVVELRRTRAR